MRHHSLNLVVCMKQSFIKKKRIKLLYILFHLHYNYILKCCFFTYAFYVR